MPDCPTRRIRGSCPQSRMDYEEYRQCIRMLRQKYGGNVGITWRKAHLEPKFDVFDETLGWRLVWVGVFMSDHFVRLKED